MDRTRLATIGDAEFQDVYREHHGALVRLASRWLGGDDAEQVAHEVLIDHWLRPQRFDASRGTLRTFLLMGSRSRAIDACRSESARRRRNERYVRRNPVDAEVEVEDTDARARVAHALALLPDRQREAIELAFYGGLSYREVADRLGDPEGTVKSRIRAGLAKLRTTLGPADLLAAA